MLSEKQMDALLQIQTCGEQKGFLQSFQYHRYEPTPYSALAALFTHYELKKGDHLIDFGSGKGRLPFYVNHHFQIEATGVEMSEILYEQAIANREQYLKKKSKSRNALHFHCGFAENYTILPNQNRFFFFNPFTAPIFMKVVGNILQSREEAWREMDIILYYPADDYLHFLDRHASFIHVMDVPVPEQYGNNEYERFVVYRLR